MKAFLKSIASVRPTEQQLAWFDTSFYAFVHFTVNTYTDLEWGLGNEDPAIFNPRELDCDEWVRAVKSAGMKGLILTAKHHDGFCLWPSAYTEHSVKNSPWKNGQGDVVRECAEACARGGIRFGVYLSPWDRNSPYYGTEAYNDYYCNQLTELLTQYGELFEVWFDGACGEGPNGKKQVYDFDRYIALIRKYQPNAVIFNGWVPDVRWCGNEAGQSRRSEWAVVPSELFAGAVPQSVPGPLSDGADLSYLNTMEEDIGDLHRVVYSKGLVFAGAETDMSIRPGWFYHAKEEPHSLDRLFDTYLRTCGANTCFNLNIPPMPSGRFDPRDIARLRELGEAIENAFGEARQIPLTVTEEPGGSETQKQFLLQFPKETSVAYVELAEDLSEGQRIEAFRIENGGTCLYRGTTAGHRRICPVSCKTDRLTVRITASRDVPVLRFIRAYSTYS